MRWMTFFVLGMLLLVTVVPTRAATRTPDPVPDVFSPTARALYALTWVSGPGDRVGDFMRAVPGFASIHLPDEIVAACQRLGFQAEHRRATWNDLANLDGAFLAPDQADNWSLYRISEGNLFRIEVPSLAKVPVPPDQFRSEWNQEIITVVRSAPSGGGTPAVEFSQTQHDFGEIKEGDKVSHLFPFESVGSATLEIVNVHPGCGCSAVTIGLVPGTGAADEADITWGVKSFPPGSHGVARFEYDSKGRRGQTGSYAEITTNAPVNRVVRITVRANVLVPVDVMPTMVSFGYITMRSHPEQDIRIKASEDASFRILSATVSTPNIRLNLTKIEPAGESAAVEYVLKVSLDLEGLEPGRVVNDTIWVRTTSKWKPVIQIPVNATVKPPVYTTPDVVRLVPRRRGGDPTGYLIVIGDPSRDVELKDIRSDMPNLTFEQRPLGQGRYQVMAVLETENPDQPVSGTITIETTDPEMKTITAPVTYTPIRRP